ncbi:hypothetical protein Glove_103g218 [Diversispora epigaea]|uniref:CSC1/OSCA1-like 7TM region domain-containing protein n=1 Tax=Diversispora epigaea TaxID=1348612 RepID=A0A397J5V8_9GLOM|nr:hypothetical protein Glove_103g218 [Diversispora epigaea]
MTDSSSDQVSADSSVSAFTSALIFNGAITLGLYITFDIIRKRVKKVYEPRSYLLSRSKGFKSPPGGLLTWISAIFKAHGNGGDEEERNEGKHKDKFKDKDRRLEDQIIISKIGLDAFMFIRFMRMFMIIFMIFTIIGIGVILPINYIGQSNLPGLKQFTMGNILDNNRLYVHVGAAYIFTGIILYMIYRETDIYIKLRHTYCATHEHQKSLRATTIYVPDIPSHLIHNVEELKKLFEIFPGGVKKIWYNRYPQKLIEAQSERQKIIMGLEAAETAFILNYDKKSTESKELDDDNLKQFRPAQRTKTGMKQDAIESNRKRLVKFNHHVEELKQKEQEKQQLEQQKHKKSNLLDDYVLNNPLIFSNLNSAFIQFNNYMGAQLAANSTTTRITGISPDDVIWENLNIAYSQRLIRKVISISITTALILVWLILVTFVAAVSKLSKLGETISFLEPAIDSLPISVLGIIEGILPALAISILMIILSIVLRALSKFEGIITYSGVEISLQKKYYFFLIVNVLLVTTFANGIFEALPALIDSPTSIINTLATNLPLASTFFLTYVLLSISGSAVELLQIGPLVMYILFKKLSNTPRKVWQNEKQMKMKDWGTTFPPHILIAVIGLVYSSIQPIILPIVTIHFLFFFLAYKYNFFYVYNQIFRNDGLLFPIGISQFYIGIYIYQLVMIGLMFLNEAFIPGVLMVVLLGLTIISIILNKKFVFQRNPYAKFLSGKFILSEIDIFDSKISIRDTSFEGDDDSNVGGGATKRKEGSEEEIQVIKKEAAPRIETEEEENYYTNPAFNTIQPSVWLPQDPAKLSIKEIEECQNQGIKATNRGAVLQNNQIVVDLNDVPAEIEFVTHYYFGEYIREDDYLH